MSESSNKAGVQEQQQAPSRVTSNALSQKYIHTFFTVPWMEFNISAKPNHQALAADPVVKHLIGETARAALDNIADKVTERIVSAMRGIIEETMQEAINDDIPNHVAASLKNIFQEHPVPAMPAPATAFQRLSSRALGEKSMRERAASIAPTAPKKDLAPAASAPAPVDEVSGEQQTQGSFAESELTVTSGPPPPNTLSDHLPELRKRFVEPEAAGPRDTNTNVQNSAEETNLIEAEDTADAPPPADVVEEGDERVEAQPESVQSELEKEPSGVASPSPDYTHLGDLDGKEKEAETVVETEAQDENDSGVKATHEGADIPVSGDNNENIDEAKDSHDSVDNTGDPEAVESTSAAAKVEVENEFQVQGEQATADEVDEQGSSTDLESPRMFHELESMLVPDISSASWIWSTSNSTSQENIGSGGGRVFRKVAQLPIKVNSMIIDIAFPNTGQYTIYANGDVAEHVDGGHEDGVKVQRFEVNLDKPTKKVVIAVSAPVGGDIADISRSDTRDDSKTVERAGLLLAGVLWMSDHFKGSTCKIKTDASWQSAVVASGETGFTKAGFSAEWMDVTVVRSYGTKPSGGFRVKDQTGSEPEQLELAEPHGQSLVSEVAQEGTEDGKNTGGE